MRWSLSANGANRRCLVVKSGGVCMDGESRIACKRFEKRFESLNISEQKGDQGVMDDEMTECQL